MDTNRHEWSLLRTSFVLMVLLLAGCAMPALDSARRSYYQGNAASAVEQLEDVSPPKKDTVLFHMERGLMRQGAGDYEASTRDLVKAADWYEQFETYSLSKGASSWIINDNVQNFRGAPFERTLLHAFAALNHLALGRWNDAGVEARRILNSIEPQVEQGYPEDPYARYLAGFCLQVSQDEPNAELQFRKANDLLPHVDIDPHSGAIGTPPTTGHELVVFVGMGRALGWSTQHNGYSSSGPTYAEIYHRGTYLGRSHAFTDTTDLRFTTEQIEAARKTAKTVGRVVLKEAIAVSVEAGTGEEVYGDLVRLLLIGLLEQPDNRFWKTLPRHLQVARIPCPENLDEYTVQFKTSQGFLIRSKTVTAPIQKYRNTFVSFCRDIPAPERR